jgi:hypothetical protein
MEASSRIFRLFLSAFQNNARPPSAALKCPEELFGNHKTE